MEALGKLGGTSDEGTRTLVVVGQLVGLLVVLLPAVGASVRALAFSTTGRFGDDWLRAGLADPLSTLAALGLINVLIPVVLVGLTVVLEGAEWRRRQEHRELRWSGRGTLAVGAGLMIAAVLFAPDFPAALVVGLAGVIGFGFVSRLHRRGVRLRLGTAWPLLAVLFVTGIGAGFISGRVDGVSLVRYTFADKAPVAQGNYIRFGQADGLTFIEPCNGKDRTVKAIRSDFIEAESLLRPPHSGWTSRSLAQLLFLGHSLHAGVKYPC